MEALLQLSHQIGLALLFLVLLSFASSRDVPRLLRPVAGTAVLVSCIGLAQYSGWELFLRIPSAGMPSATLGYRNFAAMYVILCLPLCAFLLVTAGRRRELWTWGVGLSLLLGRPRDELMHDPPGPDRFHDLPTPLRGEGPVLVGEDGALEGERLLVVAGHLEEPVRDAPAEAFLPEGVRPAPVEVDDPNPVGHRHREGPDGLADGVDAVLLVVGAGDLVQVR